MGYVYPAAGTPPLALLPRPPAYQPMRIQPVRLPRPPPWLGPERQSSTRRGLVGLLGHKLGGCCRPFFPVWAQLSALLGEQMLKVLLSRAGRLA